MRKDITGRPAADRFGDRAMQSPKKQIVQVGKALRGGLEGRLEGFLQPLIQLRVLSSLGEPPSLCRTVVTVLSFEEYDDIEPWPEWPE